MSRWKPRVEVARYSSGCALPLTRGRGNVAAGYCGDMTLELLLGNDKLMEDVFNSYLQLSVSRPTYGCSGWPIILYGGPVIGIFESCNKTNVITLIN